MKQWQKVTFLLPNGKEIVAEVLPEITGREVLNFLTERGFVEDTRGMCQLSLLSSTGEYMDEKKTLEEYGVRNGSRVRVIQEWIGGRADEILYGCPSAREVEGIVPSCMLDPVGGPEEIEL